jgi:cytochrome bd-type quinol oxidase subunit 1
MKVSGKPVATGVGVFFIAFAVLCAVLLMPGAKESQSPFLYVCVFGGLFVGVPAILGIAVVHENLHSKSRNQTSTRS